MYIFIGSFTQQQITSLKYYVMCYHIDVHQTHTKNSKFNVVTETCDIRIVPKRIRSRASLCLCTCVCMYVYKHSFVIMHASMWLHTAACMCN